MQGPKTNSYSKLHIKTTVPRRRLFFINKITHIYSVQNNKIPTIREYFNINLVELRGIAPRSER
jgi:hypothetical protein